MRNIHTFGALHNSTPQFNLMITMILITQTRRGYAAIQGHNSAKTLMPLAPLTDMPKGQLCTQSVLHKLINLLHSQTDQLYTTVLHPLHFVRNSNSSLLPCPKGRYEDVQSAESTLH